MSLFENGVCEHLMNMTNSFIDPMSPEATTFFLIASFTCLLASSTGYAQESGTIDLFENQGSMPVESIEIGGTADGNSPVQVDLGDEPEEWTVPGCLRERSTTDRPDDSRRPQLRVLYVVPSDGRDESLDVNGKICRSIQAIGRWLQQQTGGPSLRFDTFQGKLDIGFVRLDQTDAEIVGREGGSGIEDGPTWIHHRIAKEVDLQPDKIYVAYYAGTTKFRCGSAPHPPRIRGQLAGVYLKGHPKGQHACDAFGWGNARRPQYMEYLVMHEIVHTLGFVQDSPNSHDEGHVFDAESKHPERDLMYSKRDDSDPVWNTRNRRGLILDVGRDDYYGHDREGAADLAKSAFLMPTPAGAVMPP